MPTGFPQDKVKDVNVGSATIGMNALYCNTCGCVLDLDITEILMNYDRNRLKL